MFDILIIIITILLCGQLWRMGGYGERWARIYVLPITIGLSKTYLLNWNWYAMIYAPVLMSLLGLFSYGLDSKIHNIFEWIFKKGYDGNDPTVESCVRFICGFFWSLAGIVFAYITYLWSYQIIYTIFLSIANIIFGYLVKDVRYSERLVGYSIATSILI